VSDTATTIPSFNPSKDPRVDDINAKTEELLTLVRSLGGDARCKSLAITNYEQAAMWAVKSLFVK
jgi:hypothetical protein